MPAMDSIRVAHIATSRPDYHVNVNVWYNDRTGPARGYYATVRIARTDGVFEMSAVLGDGTKTIRLDTCKRFVRSVFDSHVAAVKADIETASNHGDKYAIRDAIDNCLAIEPSVKL